MSTGHERQDGEKKGRGRGVRALEGRLGVTGEEDGGHAPSASGALVRQLIRRVGRAKTKGTEGGPSLSVGGRYDPASDDGNSWEANRTPIKRGRSIQ